MDYQWLIGLGMIFGFGLGLTFLVDFSIETFLGFETLISAYVIWMEFLPLWILIINILVLTYIAILEIKNKSY